MESHLKERKNSGGGIFHLKAIPSTGENINEYPPKVKKRRKVLALREIVFYHKTSGMKKLTRRNDRRRIP
jgi:hypothetical protein